MSTDRPTCTRCGRNPPGPVTYNLRPERVTLCSECRDHANLRPDPDARKRPLSVEHALRVTEQYHARMPRRAA